MFDIKGFVVVVIKEIKYIKMGPGGGLGDGEENKLVPGHLSNSCVLQAESAMPNAWTALRGYLKSHENS